MRANTKLRRREVVNAGVPIPEGTSLYRPGGYPRLGLAPLDTKLSAQSSSLLEKQFLHAEHQRGNTMFSTSGLSNMDPRLGSELVSVYLGLAEKYRGANVDFIDFHADLSGYISMGGAITVNFGLEYPQLYSVARDLGSGDINDVVMAIYSGEYDRNTTARVTHELARVPRKMLQRDALSHGSIWLSECMSHPKCSGLDHAWSETRNLSRARRNKPLSCPPIRTSLASAIFVHEFGHVIENAIVEQGEDSWKYVIGVLEDCVLRKPNGQWRVSSAQLREAGLTRDDARLINYPRHYDPSNAGNGKWNKVIRDVVGKEMSWEIGIYASDWLEECFAEAFMQSIVTAVPETRAQLAPFQDAIYELGISVKRRHR